MLLPIFEAARPADARPRAALDALDDWVAGKVSLTVVKPLVLAAHAAAREAIAEGNIPAGYAARAAGQAASSVHATGHVLGPIYYAARIGPGEKERLAATIADLPPELRQRVCQSL